MYSYQSLIICTHVLHSHPYWKWGIHLDCGLKLSLPYPDCIEAAFLSSPSFFSMGLFFHLLCIFFKSKNWHVFWQSSLYYVISDIKDTLSLANDLSFRFLLSLTPNSLFGHYSSASVPFLWFAMLVPEILEIFALKNSKYFPHLSTGNFSVQFTCIYTNTEYLPFWN